MKKLRPKPNVFMINTPHQLLNAIEAVHLFQLTNNHLIVLLPKHAARERFIALIKANDWMTVSFPSPFIESKRWVEKLLGPVVHGWYYRCLHLRRMLTVGRLTARFKKVDKLFLGQYLVEHVPYMMHMANAIEYNTLYLLDDGTDTIEIAKRRHRFQLNECEARFGTNKTEPSAYETKQTHVRGKHWKWNLAEAKSVTFFTSYDIDVVPSDRLIRNDYSYLRSLACPQQIDMSDTVLFLGLCVSDGVFEVNAHLEFLSLAREYFAEKKFVYVAHPRESAASVAKIREQLQCELWPSSSVIEYDLITRGVKPGAVAGFVSSALLTLANLMDSDVDIVCFQIPPEYWLSWREDAMGVYNYLKEKAEPRVTVAPLSSAEIESKSHLSSSYRSAS
jgi:hypothetical protein